MNTPPAARTRPLRHPPNFGMNPPLPWRKSHIGEPGKEETLTHFTHSTLCQKKEKITFSRFLLPLLPLQPRLLPSPLLSGSGTGLSRRCEPPAAVAPALRSFLSALAPRVPLEGRCIACQSQPSRAGSFRREKGEGMIDRSTAQCSYKLIALSVSYVRFVYVSINSCDRFEDLGWELHWHRPSPLAAR